MTEHREDCYFYYESQEMGAHVPNCAYDEKYEYGFCPCNNDCKNYISKKEAYKLIKKIVRCKDCKYRPTPPKAWGAEIDGQWCYWCKLQKAWKPDNWYCADGKREEGDGE